MPDSNTLSSSLQDALNGRTVAVAKLADVIGGLAVNLTISVVIIAVAIWASRWAARLVRQTLNRFPRLAEDQTLADFASSLARYGVVIIGLIAVLRRLGVETTSIITVLGAASLAIGLALQGALTNVAAGVMILFFRPYRVGDVVTIAGKSGTIRHFDLFNTEMYDFNNLKIVVPNGKAFGDVVVNYTDIGTRRIELVFRIGYTDDIEKATATAIRCAGADPRVLKDPAPWCKLTELADSTCNITLRCWTRVADNYETQCDLLRKVKETFDAEGVSFPFPTQISVDRPLTPSDHIVPAPALRQ